MFRYFSLRISLRSWQRIAYQKSAVFTKYLNAPYDIHLS